MSISFAPARCREWSFRPLGGEGHLPCASRESHGRLPSSSQQRPDGWAWVPSATGRSQLPAQPVAVHISTAQFPLGLGILLL
jgi:hypothetical protein